MVIFHSYVKLPEGNGWDLEKLHPCCHRPRHQGLSSSWPSSPGKLSHVQPPFQDKEYWPRRPPCLGRWWLQNTHLNLVSDLLSSLFTSAIELQYLATWVFVLLQTRSTIEWTWKWLRFHSAQRFNRLSFFLSLHINFSEKPKKTPLTIFCV